MQARMAFPVGVFSYPAAVHGEIADAEPGAEGLPFGGRLDGPGIDDFAGVGIDHLDVDRQIRLVLAAAKESPLKETPPAAPL